MSQHHRYIFHHDILETTMRHNDCNTYNYICAYLAQALALFYEYPNPNRNSNRMINHKKAQRLQYLQSAYVHMQRFTSSSTVLL